ncbi:hypothetical protein D3C87_1944920 [compost metagenome]
MHTVALLRDEQKVIREIRPLWRYPGLQRVSKSVLQVLLNGGDSGIARVRRSREPPGQLSDPAGQLSRQLQI